MTSGDTPRIDHQATAAVRAGHRQFVDDQHSEALVLTSGYIFDDARDAAEKFAARRPGNVYVRFTNPTVRAFEERVAALEGGDDAVAMASGMAAYMSLSLAFLKTGDHVLLAKGVFGTTTRLYEDYLDRFGVTTTALGVEDSEAWRRAMTPETKMLVVESPTNPVMQIADIEILANIAHEGGALLVVDNTLCTPIFQRPLLLGADIVLHSAGKYLDGQGRCGGGVVTGPDVLMQAVRGVMRTIGPSLSPFNAWILLKSLETLPIRMEAHNARAHAISSWLEDQVNVRQVYYCGSPSHPQAGLIKRQQSGAGGLLSFEIEGGEQAAWLFIDALSMISNTTNIGDTKSMATHPGTTTHGRLTEMQKALSGITPGLIRLSIGLEHLDDITRDIDQALRKARAMEVRAHRKSVEAHE